KVGEQVTYAKKKHNVEYQEPIDDMGDKKELFQRPYFGQHVECSEVPEQEGEHHTLGHLPQPDHQSGQG
ncbi:MAG: hypothetical protein ACKPKO_10505, partial [Candidatus Fonsibacter sp.]